MSALDAVLAGGRGRRMGERKPLAQLGGAPLPPGLRVLHEPDQPYHPLLGIVTALEYAGRPVVAVACDQPFVPAGLLARPATGPEGAVRLGGRIEPSPARYEPTWPPDLRAAPEREAPMRTTLDALQPTAIEWDAAALRGVDIPQDLTAAHE